MFCSNCGTKLQDGAKFCHNCGAPVISNTAPAENVIPEAPAQMPEPTFAAPVFTPAEPEIPEYSVPEPVFEPEITEIPEPAFAAPEFTPAEPVVEEAPVFEMPQDTYTGTASPYTSASPFDQNAPVSADAPKEIGGEVPSYSYTYGMPQSSATKTADYSVPAGNPYTAAAPVTQTQGEYTAPAGSKKGSKSEKRKRLIAIVIVFALLAGCWYWFFGRGGKDSGGETEPSPSVTVEDPTELPEYAEAVSALENGDFETAIPILEDLSKRYLESDEVYGKLLEAYGEKFLNVFDTQEFAANEAFAVKFAELMPDNTATLLDAYYSDWLKGIYRGELGDDYGEVFSRAKQYLSEDNIATFEKLINLDVVFANVLAAAVDEKSLDLACYAFSEYSDIVELFMMSHKEEPARIKVEGHEYSDVIVYYDDANDRYYAYYGQLDENGAREGKGSLVCLYDQAEDSFRVYWYQSEWSGDIPNGQFYECLKEYDSELNVLDSTVWYGTLTHGLYDGLFYEIYEGNTYVGEYSEGKCVSRDESHTTESGAIACMIGLDDPSLFLYMMPEYFDIVYGVDFY